MARRRSLAYPTNHLLAVVDDPTAADAAAEAIVRGGMRRDDVTLLRGDSSAALGGLGARHRLLTRIIRAVQYMTMDQMPDFGRYEQALAEGRTVIAVYATDRPAMLRARDVLRSNGAHFLNYYGRVATEELGRWREPGAEEWIDRPFPEAEARKRRR
jgi:hypothetical protein